EAEVNLATAEARVAYLPGLTGPEAMVEAVAAAGYGAREISDDGEARDRERASREAEIAGLRRSLAFAAAFTLPLVVVSMGRHVPGAEQSVYAMLPHRAWMLIELLL